jgi:RimJ/RimL family protein N-acetyltransferase
LYETNILATAENADGVRFNIVEGLSEKMAKELKKHSLDTTDTELQKTSDHERFGKGSYEEWYTSKERTLFALVHAETEELAALAWFGPKPFGRKSAKHLSSEERSQDERLLDSGAWHTIVYRSYAPFRGKGLMKDFVRFCTEKYLGRNPGGKLWAGIYSENPASIGLAKALGFTIAEEGRGTNETLMVKE